MKTNIIKFTALLMVCCAMLGCKPEEEEKFGTIFGIVTDYSSGNPINNVNVRLNPRGETTLTGSDGSFQFNNLPAGSYSLSLSKDGYADLDDDYVIEIENGNSVHRDVQIKKNKIHVYGVVTDQEGEPVEGVTVFVAYPYYYGDIGAATITTSSDGSFSMTFYHNNPDTDQCYVQAKKYVSEVGHYCWSIKYFFTVSDEQEFNINPILIVE